MQELPNLSIRVPQWFMQIRYNPRVIPDGSSHQLLETGANCQVFAYTLLRHNGKQVPDLRSMELWEDEEFSTVAENFEPLDILFFKKDKQPWGAHLGVYLGNEQVLHLSRKVGKPIIWKLNEFNQVPAYQVLIGGKRFKNIR